MRRRHAGSIIPRQMAERRIAEPKLVLLAAGAVVVLLLCIVAIAETGDVWLVALTALAVGLIGGAIVLDLRRVIAATGDADEVEAPPGRAIVVSTMPMTAGEVLDAIGPVDGEASSIMVVCPAGLGGGGLMAGEHDRSGALHEDRDRDGVAPRRDQRRRPGRRPQSSTDQRHAPALFCRRADRVACVADVIRFQGFLFSRPLPPAELEAILHEFLT